MRLSAVAFSPNGKLIVTGSEAQYSYGMWNWTGIRTLTNKEIRTLKGHTPDVFSVTFSPDVKQVVTGSSDNNDETMERGYGPGDTNAQRTHTLPFLSVAFSANGKQIVTGSSDNTTRIYDRAAWEGSLAILKQVALRQVHNRKLSPKELNVIVKSGVQYLPALPPLEQPTTAALPVHQKPLRCPRNPLRMPRSGLWKNPTKSDSCHRLFVINTFFVPPIGRRTCRWWR